MDGWVSRIPQDGDAQRREDYNRGILKRRVFEYFMLLKKKERSRTSSSLYAHLISITSTYSNYSH